MKVVALISGGKDSCYNMMRCVAEGHELVALANLKPVNKDELDSYMYQSVGYQAIDLYAEAMDLPLFRQEIQGQTIVQEMEYFPTALDEVEDLYKLLERMKKAISFEGVAVGAILSDFQRIRVENVCARLNLTPLAYLWRCDQTILLQNMIDCEVDAIIIKVASLGLLPYEHLGKNLIEIQEHLLSLEKQYGSNVCGEGGEYETFTLDCPLFRKKIIIDEMEIVIHSDDAFAPVGYLSFKKMHTEDKKNVFSSFDSAIENLPILKTIDFLKEFYSPMQTNSIKLIYPTLSSYSREDLNMLHEAILLSNDNKPRINRSEGFIFITGIEGYFMIDSDSVSGVTQVVMEKLKNCVISFGLTMDDVISVSLYLSDMKDFATVNNIYKTFFNINPPIRICVEVPLLQGQVINLESIVCQGYNKTSVNTMHVQSISHWAPANIGPYSQAKKVGSLIFIAGQIGLIPSSLTLISDGISDQCFLSLRHISRILQVMSSNCDLQNVIMGVCFLVNDEHVRYAKKIWEDYVISYLKDKEGFQDCQPVGPSAFAYENKMRSELCSPLLSPNKMDRSQSGSPTSIGGYEKKCIISCSMLKMMCYVIVSGLPKGALVEWQVIAVDTVKYSFFCKTLKHIWESFELISHHCFSKDESYSFISICMASQDIFNMDITIIKSKFLDHLKKLLEECKQLLSSVNYIKVFYKSVCPAQILKDILNIFSHCAVQLIPVIGFAVSHHFLLIQLIAM